MWQPTQRRMELVPCVEKFPMCVPYIAQHHFFGTILSITRKNVSNGKPKLSSEFHVFFSSEIPSFDDFWAYAVNLDRPSGTTSVLTFFDRRGLSLIIAPTSSSRVPSPISPLRSLETLSTSNKTYHSLVLFIITRMERVPERKKASVVSSFLLDLRAACAALPSAQQCAHPHLLAKTYS